MKVIAGLFVLITLGIVFLGVIGPNATAMGAKSGPNIEDYATIEAYVGKDEVPVYAFGYTYVYGLSPDLLPGVKMQEGNSNPIVKVKPKKSWEIKNNLCGSTPGREPKTMWNDDQPLLPVHLIDGDPETAWMSKGGCVPDRQPEWIRIDIPAEATVGSVVLVCSNKGPAVRSTGNTAGGNFSFLIGRALPKKITVKLSQNAKDWETVYENKSYSGKDSGPNVIEFEPRRAKQVWIIGENLTMAGYWEFHFSLGEVEVRDTQGNNLALVSKGAGVQVSSTHYGYGQNRFTQDMLWPVQYDLGFKWTRVGYDMGMYLWSYVEREKGKLQIDRRADECITEAHKNGVNVIMCLDKGNWLYANPPRKVDWKKCRVREMMETYYDRPPWPTESKELMDGYLRYVDYMVRHFKGRVSYYEVCNEWGLWIGTEEYYRLINAVIPVIRKADPYAKIMIGSVASPHRDHVLALLGKQPDIGVKAGKLSCHGHALIVAEKPKLKDVSVSLDAKSDAEAGIMLRFQNPRNFLLAFYNCRGNIYFHEVVDGDYGGEIDVTKAEGLGPDIKVTAEVRGSDAVLRVTDGNKTCETKHTISKCNEAGLVGVYHCMEPGQLFDNVEIKDASGNVVLNDDFSSSDGPIPGWKIVVPFVMKKGLAEQVDAIGWHPWYNADPDSATYKSYRKDITRFMKECRDLGFKGQFAATEWLWSALYPGAVDWCTEMGKAKYSAQLMTAHCGMDIISLFNETFQMEKIGWDSNLLRAVFSVDPIPAAEPQPVYYVLRNISTVLDDFRPADLRVRFSGDKQFDCYTFTRGGNEMLIAAWIPGRTKDGINESRSDVTLPGITAKRAVVVDVLNGTEQELTFAPKANSTVLPEMLIKDYPTFIRIERM